MMAIPMILMLDSLDGSLDAQVNNGNVNLLISQHESVNIRVKSGLFFIAFVLLVLICSNFLFSGLNVLLIFTLLLCL